VSVPKRVGCGKDIHVTSILQFKRVGCGKDIHVTSILQYNSDNVTAIQFIHKYCNF
jgi:hypothetical protein